jgi:hypothetical protein
MENILSHPKHCIKDKGKLTKLLCSCEKKFKKPVKLKQDTIFQLFKIKK